MSQKHNTFAMFFLQILKNTTLLLCIFCKSLKTQHFCYVFFANFNTSILKSLPFVMNFNTSLLKSLHCLMNFNTSLLNHNIFYGFQHLHIKITTFFNEFHHHQLKSMFISSSKLLVYFLKLLRDI